MSPNECYLSVQSIHRGRVRKAGVRVFIVSTGTQPENTLISLPSALRRDNREGLTILSFSHSQIFTVASRSRVQQRNPAYEIQAGTIDVTTSGMKALFRKLILLSCILVVVSILISGCKRVVKDYTPWRVPGAASTLVGTPQPTLWPEQTLTQGATTVPPTSIPQVTLTLAPVGMQPTPNAPLALPALRTSEDQYTIQQGDSLARIALLNQVSVKQILERNDLKDPDLIKPGEVLIIPPASANEQATSFKIIPESELVYSPSAKDFHTESVVWQFNGKLSRYEETLEDESQLSGAEIVQRVADENGVNPRLLLALLEYQSGWVRSEGKNGIPADYPLGLLNPYYKGLYKQLGWAANELLRGSTLWELGSLAVWVLSDGEVMRIDATINPATAGVQHFFSLVKTKPEWRNAVSETGLYATYAQMFGFPFAFSIEPLVPEGLTQPEFILPLAPGDIWLLTSGPHWGYGTGSIWAALDFAPPGKEDDYGCYESDAPVLAVANGLVVRSGAAAVVLDLDGDGLEQTGWTVHYFHIGTEGRIPVGTQVASGDVIGYASCEGGVTSGTHFHIARRYNGVWIGAAGRIPFDLGGWIASSYGTVYDGTLTKNGETVEAYDGRADFNEIGN
jgi:LasA protease